MRKKEEKEKMICLSTVKDMGFNKKLIEALLPEPELKDNPNYKCAAPMKLWKLADVEAAMETDEYKAEQVKREKRLKSAQKAVQTKTDKLITLARESIDKISVQRIDLGKLREKTLAERQAHHNYKCVIEGQLEPIFQNDMDGETLNRWMVDYIRHYLTKNDRRIKNLKGKTGEHEAYHVYFDGMLSIIAKIYPELKTECEKQIASKKMVYMVA